MTLAKRLRLYSSWAFAYLCADHILSVRIQAFAKLMRAGRGTLVVSRNKKKLEVYGAPEIGGKVSDQICEFLRHLAAT